MVAQREVVVNGQTLTIEQVAAVAYDHAHRVVLDPAAKTAVQTARRFVDDLAARGEVAYGITTGFGNFKHVTIAADQTAQLQVNLIRSHAVGVGRPLSEPEVRAMLLIRANSLVKGHSGVRLELIEALMALVNAGVYPHVPEQGSVGASGDLAPLAHLGLALMGEGEAWVNGQQVPIADVLRRHGLQPIQFGAKEGLALTNGTTFMTAVVSLAVGRALIAAKVADIAGALTLEAIEGSIGPMDERVAALRPHPGHAQAAANLRRLTKGSGSVASLKGWKRVQDSYTLRCLPQVHGAVRDALAHVREVVARELNAATDNPLVFPEDREVLSAGNFHGEPIALPADYLGTAVAELGSISERRTAKLVDPATSEGLPAFLIPPSQAGLSSGLMIPQYTAAALVSENKVLAHPASVDSIPTSANQEDHVSMGSIAARKAREIVTNVEMVLAVELLSAAQAVDLRERRGLGQGTKVAHDLIRSKVPFVDRDRALYPDMEAIAGLIRSGELVRAVERAVGSLA